MKLLKYEIRKGITLKLILLGIFALLEGFFVEGCLSHNAQHTSMAAMLLLLTGTCGILALGVQSMLTLHHDMNTKQAYMLFLTPRSCYSILGAKLIESVLSIFIAAGLCTGAAVLDASLLNTHFGQIKQIADVLQQLAQAFEINMNVMSIVTFCADLLFGWVFMVTTAYLADVLVSAMFRGKKFGGLLAFVLFLVLNTVLGKLTGLVQLSDPTAHILVHFAIDVAGAAVMYIASARIMETKLSV